MKFKGKTHENIFRDAVMESNPRKQEKRFIAALYLLTAEDLLWRSVKKYVHDGKIEFEKINPAGVSTSGYAMYISAKELYTGEKLMSISELTEREILSDKSVQLIIEAVKLKRERR